MKKIQLSVLCIGIQLSSCHNGEKATNLQSETEPANMAFYGTMDRQWQLDMADTRAT